MAAYQSGFDPPNRPGDPSGGRRIPLPNAYTPPSWTTRGNREQDIAHISGQVDQPRRAHTPVGRSQQTGLPRPSMRDPSPNTESISEARRGFMATTPGYGRPVDAPGTPPHQLRAKSSRNVLRRKPTSVGKPAGPIRSTSGDSSASSPEQSRLSAESRPNIESSLKTAEAYNEIFTRTRARTPAGTREKGAIVPELDRYRNIPEPTSHVNSRTVADLPHKLATQDLPPPTPLLSQTPGYSSGGSNYHRYSGYSASGYSASPSTRFSESPGPGPYSRDTTPTSMSSSSSAIMAPLKTTTPRLWQGSPAGTRPPVTRRRAGSVPNDDDGAPLVDPHGLPSLRESVTSSSSNSTVRGEKGENKTPQKKKKKRLSPLPPSPPPRSSSQKKTGVIVEQTSPSKPSQAPAKPVMMPEVSPPKLRSPAPILQTKNIAPSRPSRDGAPDLQTEMSTPVIQSNLAGFTFSQDKRGSVLPLPRSAVTSPRSLQGSRLPSRNPSPSPIGPSHREATPAPPAGLGIIPDLKPQVVSTRGAGTRTPSPGIANTKSRFGLFGRRTKTVPEVTTVDNSKLRKGPAAGTGHEGYGRYAMRGRSSSAGGLGHGRDRSMSGASSSQESFASSRAHDPFLLERMSPVVITGGGGIESRGVSSSELSRSESNTSLLLNRPSMDSKGSVKSGLSHEVSRTTLWPSALPREPVSKREPMPGRRPSDSSDDGYAKPAIVIRRSIQRLNSSSSGLSLPQPLKISGVTSPSMVSVDASILSDSSAPDPKGLKPKKLEKRSKSPRKWNFFHREKPAEKPAPQPTMTVSVGKPAAKAVPHYAMLDSSDDQNDVDNMDLEDILRDAEVIGLSNEELDKLVGDHEEKKRRHDSLQAMVLQPVVPVAEPQVDAEPIIFSSPEPIEVQFQPAFPLPEPELHLENRIETPPARPSRLPQVGRIPKVRSTRPQATSPKSFSRPFARLSVSRPVLPPPIVDQQSLAVGPSPPKPSTPELFQPEIAPTVARQSDDSTTSASNPDFIRFSPRKNSEATTSSSGSHSQSYIGTTAVIPSPTAALVEDEVWDEFDDLLSNDNPLKIPTSATSSHGEPFQYESYESRRARKSKMVYKESMIVKPMPPPMINEPEKEEGEDDGEEGHIRRSALTASSVYSRDLSGHLHLRESLDVAEPSTPMSFTDFFSGYGDRNNSVLLESASKHRLSSASQKSDSSSCRSISHSNVDPIPDQKKERETESPVSQVNLRVGSMTVSKWLTFGHVLFSPAREEISAPITSSSTKPHSILVVDALGNGKPLCLFSQGVTKHDVNKANINR